MRGGSITLQCEAKAEDDVTFTWKKGAEDVTGSAVQGAYMNLMRQSQLQVDGK